MLAKVIMGLMAILGVQEPNEGNLHPTVDISAVRFIDCDFWSGSGYLIKDGIILTDEHVAKGTHCTDVFTGEPLKMYRHDHTHDIALMTGDVAGIDPIKTSCEPFKKNEVYSAYGITDYKMPNHISTIRQNDFVFSGKYEDIEYDDDTVMPHQALMEGPLVPGMSGGPVIHNGVSYGNVEGGEYDLLHYPMNVGYATELRVTALCTGKWDQ